MAEAQPSLAFVNNNDGSVTLQVNVDATGAIGPEIATEVTAGGTLSIDNVFLVDPLIFDFENPGANPFTNSVTFGLAADLIQNQVFASFGSAVLQPGTVDFLTFELSGAGTLSASGLVGQMGVITQGLTASITIVPEPTAGLLCSLMAVSAVAIPRRR